MEVHHWRECEDVQIDVFPYRNKNRDVVGTSVRWLSRAGDDGNGYPEYGLRLFTIQPGGEIPIHNHFYHQTMYILSGTFECRQFDIETDKLIQKTVTKQGNFIYIPSMEPHDMRNIGHEPATFLCCICNVYEGEVPV